MLCQGSWVVSDAFELPGRDVKQQACGDHPEPDRLRGVELKLHNTLSGQKEAFVPMDSESGQVLFYSCGPTVYDFAHIGNFRSFLNADVLRRTLELIGHDVVQVMNITDVGHMTDDTVADGGGEDKMEVASRRLAEAKKSGTLPPGVSIDADDPRAIANFYANAFLEDADRLGLKVARERDQHPERLPRPSECVPQMIEMIEALIARGHAYVAEDGVVYFDVNSWEAYGELSGNTVDRLRSGQGGRVDMETQAIKRSPADFMLWKPDPTHLMRWPSPWGEGYPGWHLECSVMARELLGDEIDLHSGGEDNIFPHHECEIAQSRATTGKSSFARYWFHTRHLMVNGAKMSKSAGTFFTIRDLIERGASPAAIRLELIRTHYRVNSNFTMQGLRDAQRQVDRWQRARAWLEEAGDTQRGDEIGPISGHLEAFKTALCDDLNIAGAIGVLNTAIAALPVDESPVSVPGACTWSAELEALNQMNRVLGVFELEAQAAQSGQEDEIEALIEERNQARAARDWGRADEIRDQLVEMGVVIKDSGDQTTWKRAVQ